MNAQMVATTTAKRLMLLKAMPPVFGRNQDTSHKLVAMSSSFLDPAAPPTEAALSERVGKAMGIVNDALQALGGKPGQLSRDWRFSKTSGWHLTYDKGGKRLFYFFPKDGDLLLKLVYNETGVHALRTAGLPEAVNRKLAGAKTYAEGTVLEFTAVEFTAPLLAALLKVKIASMR